MLYRVICLAILLVVCTHAQIVEIQGSDPINVSRAVINSNFSYLNTTGVKKGGAFAVGKIAFINSSGLIDGITTASSAFAHVHLIADVSGLQAVLDGKQTALGYTAENTTHRNAVNGYAGLDASGYVRWQNLPIGTSIGTVASGIDSRLSDARTPVAHASTHGLGESDPVSSASIGAAPATPGTYLLKGDGGGGFAQALAADIPDLSSIYALVGAGGGEGVPSGTTLPTEPCTQGALYSKTDASPSLYECGSDHLWHAHLVQGVTTDATEWLFYPPSDATNYIGFIAPATRATPVKLRLPTADPTTGQVLTFSAPSGGVSTATWATPATPGSGATSQGTFASLPGLCTVGDVYFPLPSLYTAVRCSAPNTWSFFFDGKEVTPPVATGWTWDRQTGSGGGTAQASFTNGYLELLLPSATNQGSDITAYHRVLTAPSTTTVVFRSNIMSTKDYYQRWFVGFGDGTGKMKAVTADNRGDDGYHTLVGVIEFTSTTVLTPGYAMSRKLVGNLHTGTNIWVQLVDDNTNLIFKISFDGIRYSTLLTVGRTTFFASGPTRLVIGGQNSDIGGSIGDMSIDVVGIQ